MLVVLVLCVCLLSPAKLDNVDNKKVVQETSSQLPHTDIRVQEDKVENAEISTSQGRKAQEVHPLQINTRVNEKSSQDCPNTDIFLNIFNLLTKSLQGGVVDPGKVKDVLSNIKGILEKTPLSNKKDNLHNDFKSLEELSKINNKDENKLRAKITLQYDLPSNRKHQCQDIFYALVNYINNVYNQYARYCLITGRCYVKDLPKISFSATAQLAGTQNQIPNQYPIYNPYLQGKVDTNDKGVKDKLNPQLYNPSNQYDYQISNGALNTPEYIITSNFNHMLTDKNLKPTFIKNIPLQVYSALKDTSGFKTNQDYAKVLAGKYYDATAQNINRDVFNNLETTVDLEGLVQNESVNVDTKVPNNSIQESPVDSDLYKYISYLNFGQNPTLTNPQYGGYVTPDNNLRVQLPALSQLGVANPNKLNTNQNGFVELTYMLKRPKPTYEPLYYVKYRMPYLIFLNNLQNLLIQKPQLRNDPKTLYQEILLKANVSEASGDLKNLKHEEIVSLVSQNGTLVTAKILQTNDTFVDDLKTIQDLNSNLAANLNSNTNLGIIEVIKNASFDNFTNVNKNVPKRHPGNKMAYPAPINVPTYLQTYLNKYSNMD